MEEDPNSYLGPAGGRGVVFIPQAAGRDELILFLLLAGSLSTIAQGSRTYCQAPREDSFQVPSIPTGLGFGKEYLHPVVFSSFPRDRCV